MYITHHTDCPSSNPEEFRPISNFALAESIRGKLREWGITQSEYMIYQNGNILLIQLDNGNRVDVDFGNRNWNC